MVHQLIELLLIYINYDIDVTGCSNHIKTLVANAHNVTKLGNRRFVISLFCSMSYQGLVIWKFTQIILRIRKFIRLV